MNNSSRKAWCSAAVGSLRRLQNLTNDFQSAHLRRIVVPILDGSLVTKPEGMLNADPGMTGGDERSFHVPSHVKGV